MTNKSLGSLEGRKLRMAGLAAAAERALLKQTRKAEQLKLFADLKVEGSTKN